MNNHTIDFYNLHAQEFVDGTLTVDFAHVQDRFLRRIPGNGLILDFDCGSGRDTKYFLDKGYRVEAIDGSEQLCRLASDYTGIPVKHMYFQQLDEHEKYDGIWACSSILHLRREELPEVLRRMAEALKPEGYIYTSFKYGETSGEKGGRYFTNMTEISLQALLAEVNSLDCRELWISADVRPERAEERWLNLILRKR